MKTQSTNKASPILENGLRSNGLNGRPEGSSSEEDQDPRVGLEKYRKEKQQEAFGKVVVWDGMWEYGKGDQLI